ncbi:MAG TPA: PPC domain-containing protein [Candidatus Dormibacteraeota bacterium]|nr:PPC domain-containing protein [Candidatus Dormibacteraeota bacterium]
MSDQHPLRSRLGLRLVPVLIILSLTSLGRWPAAQAAAPTFDHLFPVAFQAGTTGAVTAIGKFDPWPPQVWLDAPGITFRAATNTGRFTVEVSAAAPIGPHLARLYNEEGASGPRFIVVTSEPQLAEQEPNDDFNKPQAIEIMPASINGRLEKAGDVDSFQVWLETGQSLVAWLEAYVLASPIDAVLRVIDTEGRQLGLNHDDGRTLDPFLAYTAVKAGFYTVQVFGFAYPAGSDVRFAGSPSSIYRLHLFRGPYVHYTLPLGVSRGRATELQLVGWNLGSASQARTFDGMGLDRDCRQTTWWPEKIENTILLPVGDGPEELEQEPNDEIGQARLLSVPGAVTGRNNRPGDVDRYRLSVKKGEELRFEVQSAALGFPLDAWLRVEDQDGKELKKGDDAGGADPRLDWSAPADGNFLLAVGNVLHRGGQEYVYRLKVERPVPTVRARLGANVLVVEAGKTNEIKLNVKFTYGAKGKFIASTRGVPPDVQAAPVEVPEKGGELTLKIAAAPDAKSFSGPIQMAVRDQESGQEHRVLSDLIATGADNGVPNGFNRLLIESVDHLWLTVRAAKAGTTNAAVSAGPPPKTMLAGH